MLLQGGGSNNNNTSYWGTNGKTADSSLVAAASSSTSSFAEFPDQVGGACGYIGSLKYCGEILMLSHLVCLLQLANQ